MLSCLKFNMGSCKCQSLCPKLSSTTTFGVFILLKQKCLKSGCRAATFSWKWPRLQAVNNFGEPNYGGLVCSHTVFQSVFKHSFEMGWKMSALLPPEAPPQTCGCLSLETVTVMADMKSVDIRTANRPGRVCLECSTLCSNRHDFDSNNISKQFLNLADRKNTNHLDKCVSSPFWRGAIRIYPV